MPIITPPFVQQGGSHPAATFRHALAGLLGAPFGSFAGGITPTTGAGAHGIVGAGLAVTQNGTPNMSVNVAGGHAFVRGTEAATQGSYATYNDAVTNLVIAAADPTNPRRDLVVIRVRDAFYSGAATDAALVVVTGTPAASPADPTPPANSLVLARVAVAAAATSIVNANITSVTTRAAALGGEIICTAATRPTGAALYEGLRIYELDTNRHWRYDGAAWILLGGNVPRCDVRRSSVQSVASGTIVPFTPSTAFYNSDGTAMWNAASNPSRVFAPVAGIYQVSWSLQFGAGPSASTRQGFVTINGGGTGSGNRYASSFARVSSSADGIQLSASCPVVLAAGDYVELNAFQDSGGALNIVPNGTVNDAWLQLVWLGPTN